jgi:hypothetical protein
LLFPSSQSSKQTRERDSMDAQTISQTFVKRDPQMQYKWECKLGVHGKQ